MRLNRLLAAALLPCMAASAQSVSAAEQTFSLSLDGAEHVQWGVNKAENYDVAIFLGNPGLVGTKVRGISVPLPQNASISNTRAWLSRNLRLDNGANLPDIIQVEANHTDGTVTATFSSPFTIPEEGVYVGYSFDMAPASGKLPEELAYPITGTQGTSNDGFYIHTSGTYRVWRSYSAQLGFTSAIQVNLEGDFKPNAVGISSAGSPFCGIGKDMPMTLTLSNVGTNPVSSLEISYKDAAGTVSGSTSVSFDEPVMQQFCIPMTLDVNVPGPSEIGKYTVSVSIDKVNGEPNMAASAEVPANIAAYAFVPVNRPLVEEYTGLWCTYCPRGYAGMEYMARVYPDEFVGVVYHSGDDMQAISGMPNRVDGLPGAYFNRSLAIDPFFGSAQTGFGLETLWIENKKRFTPAAINVTQDWADEAHSKIKAVTEVTFATDPSARGYEISLMLIGNGLQNESWIQNNNYTGQTAYAVIPEMDIFISSGSQVSGLVFNDVALLPSTVSGIKGSLPEEIKVGETYTFEYEFDLSEIAGSNPNVDLRKLVKDYHVVAALVDNRGRVINSMRAGQKEPAPVSGVGDIVADSTAEVAATEWYTLQGTKIANPSAGLHIRVDIMTDGSRRASKVMLAR